MLNVKFEAMKREELRKILRGKCVTDEACEAAIDELLNLDSVSQQRELLVAFMKWQQNQWLSVNAENVDNTVDTYLRN